MCFDAKWISEFWRRADERVMSFSVGIVALRLPASFPFIEIDRLEKAMTFLLLASVTGFCD